MDNKHMTIVNLNFDFQYFLNALGARLNNAVDNQL